MNVTSLMVRVFAAVGLQKFDALYLWNYLRNYAIWLACLLALYIVVDLFTNLNAYTSGKSSATDMMKHIAGYYGVQVFQIFDRLSEVVTLLAAAFTVAWMQRSNELLPMLSAGVPTRRVIRPVVLGSVLTLALAPLNTEFVLPRLAEKLNIPREDPNLTRAMYVRGAYDPKTKEHVVGDEGFPLEKKVKKFEYTSGADTGAGLVHLSAESAEYLPAGPNRPNAGWMLYKTTPDLPLGSLPENVKHLGPGKYFVESRVDFDTITRRTSWYLYASTLDLWQMLQGGDPVKQSGVAVLFHTRLVRPLVGLFLVLLGLAVILRDQTRNVFISAGLCLGISASFLVGTYVFRYLGEQELVPAALAAWLPVLVFGPPTFFLFDAMHT